MEIRPTCSGRWLGQFRIVAEVYLWMPEPVESADYWTYDSAAREAVLHALASTGAKAVVTARKPRGGSAEDWTVLRGTSFYALRLEPYQRERPDRVAPSDLPAGKS